MEADVREIIYLDSGSSRRRISKYLSETRLSTDAQEAGLISWDICSPVVPQHPGFGIAAPALGTAGELQAGLGVLLTHWRMSHSKVGHSPHLVCLTLCILPVLRELTAQTQPSAKPHLKFLTFYMT